MSSQLSPSIDFSSPIVLAKFLAENEEFQTDKLCKYVNFTADNLPKELQNLGEITTLFTSVLQDTQGFSCHHEVQQLLERYHAFLTEASKANQQFIEESTKVINSWKAVMRASEQQDFDSGIEPLKQSKQSINLAKSCFDPVIEQAESVKPIDALVRIVEARNPDLEILEAIEKQQKQDLPLDEASREAQTKSLKNIATLDSATKTLGKIKTIVGNSSLYWQSLRGNANFAADDIDIMKKLMNRHLKQDLISTADAASRRWLAIARINQLVGQGIQPVLTELGKMLKPAESKVAATN